MGKLCRRSSVVALVFCVLVSVGSAQQSAPDMYAIVSYFKTLPGQEANYEAYLTSTARKIYQELLAAEPSMVHWNIARAWYPGMNPEYNFVSAIVFTGTLPDPGRNMDAIYAKVGMTTADLTKKLESMRTNVGSEVLIRVAGTNVPGAGGIVKEGDYRVTSFVRIKPNMGTEWADFARTQTEPTMRARVAANELKAWSVWRRAFPAGPATGYDVLGVTTWPDQTSALKGLDPAKGAEAFAKAHPGKNYGAYVTNGSEYSEMQHRLLTRIVAVVERGGAAPKTSDNP